MNATRALQWAQAMLDHGARVRPNGEPREIPLVPPRIAGCAIANPQTIMLTIKDSDDSIDVAPVFWERFWCLVSFCDDLKTQETLYGLTWRHRWWRKLVRDSKGYLHPCDCSWWQRLWRLVRGR